MATTETAQIVKIPAFSYRGFDIPAVDMSTDLINDLGISEPAYKLAPKSAPLAWRVGLYTVGRDLELGEADAEALPEPIRQAGSMIYKDCQARTEPGKGSGVWHKDGILIEGTDSTIRGSVRPGKDYLAARFFKNTEGFEERDGTWQIKTSPQTREERVWVPNGGGNFIVPTMDGAYNPITGLPFETIENRSKAVKRWIDAGLTPEEADKEISRFYRNQGTRAVYSWSYVDDGPLAVDVNDGPGGRGSIAGSFALSRSAERSEAPQNMGFRMLTEAEYEALITDRETLEAVRERVNE